MTIEQLHAEARSARENAYCPYSKYQVGASVHGNGIVSSGCNVENISYGATICAERNAILHFVALGGKKIEQMVLVTKDGATPCGVCLQVMSEFCDKDTQVHIADPDKVLKCYQFHELFPTPFSSTNVGP